MALGIFFYIKIITAIIRESIFIGVTPSLVNCSQNVDFSAKGENEEIQKELDKITRNDDIASIVSLVLILLPAVLFVIPLFILALIACCGTCRKKYHEQKHIEYSPLGTIFNCKWNKLLYHTRSSAVISLLQCFCIGLYLFDDVSEFVIHRYPDNLNCNKTCVDATLAAGRTASATAATLLHVSPLFFMMINYKIDNEYFEKVEIINNILKFGAHILKIEAAYNSVSLVIQFQSYCDIVEVVLGWIILLVCAIIGTFALFGPLLHKQVDMVTNIVLLTLLFILTLFFLITDTSQPLGCAFDCDLSHTNSTLAMANVIKVNGVHCCRVRQHAVVRLILIVVALAITVAIPTSEKIVGKAVEYYKERGNRVTQF